MTTDTEELATGGANIMTTSKATNRQPEDPDRDTLLPEYDFSEATRGATAARYAEGSDIVALDPGLRATMTWREHIHSDPEILEGKAVVRGTRLAVDFLRGLLADGWTSEQILDNYPQLPPDGLRAVFGYASEVLRDVDPGAA